MSAGMNKELGERTVGGVLALGGQKVRPLSDVTKLTVVRCPIKRGPPGGPLTPTSVEEMEAP